MHYKSFADIAGLLASATQAPVLVLHGVISFCVLVRNRRWLLDLRNWTFEGRRGRVPIAVCVLPTVYYYVDALHLAAYYENSFTSRSYFVHHVFGVHMLIFGVQGRFANYSSLLMQVSHGLLILSFQLPAYITVVMCNFYYSTGLFMVVHHLIALYALPRAQQKAACIGFLWSVGVMALLRNQQEVFASCVNPPLTPPWVHALQCAFGLLLAVVCLLPPLLRTFYH